MQEVGLTLTAFEIRMSFAVQFNLLELATGEPKTFCIQMSPETVGPLSSAPAGEASSDAPAASATKKKPAREFTRRAC
jgi:hypothetical protein